MNNRFNVSIYISFIIIIAFFVVKVLLLSGFLSNSNVIEWYEFFSLLIFLPPFYLIIKESVENNISFNNKKLALESLLNESSLFSKTDKEGNIIEVNDNFCEVSGYKKQELLGKNHSIISSGVHDESFWDEMYDVTKNYNLVWNNIVTNKSKNGEFYYVKSWIKANFNKSGDLVGFTSIQQDITQLLENSKIIEEKENEVSNMLNAINKSNSVIEFCPNGIIMKANKNFLDMFGYSLSEIKGKHHKMFVKEGYKDSAKYLKFWDDLKGGKFKSVISERVNIKGDSIYISGTYNPILDKNGKCYKILKVVSDITELVEQKEEIEKTNAYLEHAAKILRHDMHSGINTYMPRGLNSLKRRISDSDIKKLKIESSLRLLEEGLKHSQKVYRGVKEFTNLVKKDAKLDKEVCNLKDVLVSYLETTAYSKQVFIENLIESNINEPLFCTAIDNLIRNGLKYNDSDLKTVKIYMSKLKYNKQRGSYRNVLTIEDNGRGMSKKEFEMLSKPYIRKDRQKEPGTGLGLNICLAIMKEHGFDVSSEKIKTGTKIKIEIPL
jgi:PAS domain S-box-containing protein